MMTNDKDYKSARNITLWGALVNLILGIVKIFFGIVGHSVALLADGVHSLSDLLSDALVVFAAKFGRQAADHDHPYGHGRIETAATVAVAMLVIFAGLGIAIDNTAHLIKTEDKIPPSEIVIWIAGLSILVKELLYRITLHISKKIDSNLLQANAWHHRSDAASSIIVFIAVVGAYFGLTYLDAAAAVIVALLIIRMGWKLGWSSIQELVDTSIDNNLINKISSIIIHTPGIRALHQLRTRTIAGKILLDVHVLVDPKLSVSEGHHLGEQVCNNLNDKIENIADITIHVDPEDDELVQPSAQLPARVHLEEQILAACEQLPGGKEIIKYQLHYLGGKIETEIWLPLEILQLEDEQGKKLQAKELQEMYQRALFKTPHMKKLELVFTAENNNKKVK